MTIVIIYDIDFVYCHLKVEHVQRPYPIHEHVEHLRFSSCAADRYFLTVLIYEAPANIRGPVLIYEGPASIRGPVLI